LGKEWEAEIERYLDQQNADEQPKRFFIKREIRPQESDDK